MENSVLSVANGQGEVKRSLGELKLDVRGLAPLHSLFTPHHLQLIGQLRKKTALLAATQLFGFIAVDAR